MKRLLLLVLCAVLVCGLLSCGKSEEEAVKQAEDDVNTCTRNMKRIMSALRAFAWNHNGRFPSPGADLKQSIMPYIPVYSWDSVANAEDYFRCPLHKAGGSYVMNPAIAGKSLETFQDPYQTVALFESDDGRTVAYRHLHEEYGETCVVGVVAGSVKAHLKNAVASLLWSP